MCLLTSECEGQGTIALSSGESELYALGALSAELISTLCTRKSRQQHGTSSGNETGKQAGG